jgi:parallel beta-helix repeat protein
LEYPGKKGRGLLLQDIKFRERLIQPDPLLHIIVEDRFGLHAMSYCRTSKPILCIGQRFNPAALSLIFLAFMPLSACFSAPQQSAAAVPTSTPYGTPTSRPESIYYVSANGDDANTGTRSRPWKTLKHATSAASENSLIYIRGGTYFSDGADFGNNNVMVGNYPGEQVVIQLNEANPQAFNCWTTAGNGPKTDIRIVGSDVQPVTLPNGVVSKKGIVIMDAVGSQRIAFLPHGGCDRWEVAGVDFIDVADAIFTLKETYGRPGNYSADNWYVHDNRVYGYYRETGMQFNGNDNIIVNNEIYKSTPELDTPYGCYLLGLLGHGNIVRGNTLTGTGGTECRGILFEWSQSDANLIEGNTITAVSAGIDFRGGDNNIVRNNTIISAPLTLGSDRGGIEIYSYPDKFRDWPCSDYAGSSDSYPQALIPPDDPSHPDYSYYYPYGECQSYGNRIIANKISGFAIGIKFDSYFPDIGVSSIENNDITRSTIGSVCVYQNQNCRMIP